MNDSKKTKEQLIHELAELRQRVTGLEDVLQKKTDDDLQTAQTQYRSLFEHSPTALWEEDFSEIKHCIDDLRAAGIADLETWLLDHPERIAQCLELIKVNRVNRAALQLFNAGEAELVTHLGLLSNEHVPGIFLDELLALAQGETHFVAEVIQKTLTNQQLNTIVQISIAPNHEEDWEQVFVAILDLTERVRAEEARRESERRFQTAFRTSPDAINVNRLSDGLYVDINDGFTELTGFTANEVIGKTSEEINIWVNLSDREQLVKGLRETGNVKDLEAKFRLKDGTVGTGLMSARIIQFGGELCILSITRDITEYRLAQEALRASEENYRLLVEHAPSGIYEFDMTHGRFVSVNEVMCELTGFTKEEFFDLNPLDLLTEESQQQYLTRQARILNGEPVEEMVEYKIRGKRGQEFWVSIQSRITQENDILKITAVVHNITERKKAEISLAESEENYRALVENLPDFIVRFDSATRILFANTPVLQGLEMSLGLKEENILGKTYRELGFPPEQCDFWEKRIRSVWEAGETSEIEYTYETPQGVLVANWRLIPELDENGKTKSILSLSRDVTEQKRLEAESRRAEVLRAELEKEKEIIALKQQFISTVSHEFRTPLSIIKVSSDLLNQYFEKISDKRRRELLQDINLQINELTTLIDDTLDLTRAQVGKVEFNPAPVDLAPFCQAIFDQTKFASNRDQQFEFINNAPRKPVRVDNQLLKHILTNLLSNAIKYTPDNTRICFELDHNEREVIFRIMDEGIGIPEKDQGRLFEPFHRAENVGHISGTGLGLAIVKQYVELHGGQIEVESQEGKGSTFSVFLPIT